MSGLDPQDSAQLQPLLDRLGIQPDWDLLIIGDGSGSGWQGPCGWAALLVCRNHLVQGRLGRRLFAGAMTLGSVNMAESMPYLEALSWYDATLGRDSGRPAFNAHLVTDSQVIANWVQRAGGGAKPPRSGAGFVGAVQAWQAHGYRFRAHWAPRMSTGFNWACDLIAGLCRRAVLGAVGEHSAEGLARAIAAVTPHDPATGQPIDPYLLNGDARRR